MPPFVARKREASTPPPAPQRSTKKQKQEPKTSPAGSVEEKKKFLEALVASDDSSLSDIDSDDFEDALPVADGTTHSEDEDVEWENAMDEDKVNSKPGSSYYALAAEDLQLTLGKDEPTPLKDGKKKGPSKIERQIRVNTHCMHVQFLMYHNTLRNMWVSDQKVHEILLSQLPAQIKEVIDQWRRDCGNSLKPIKNEHPTQVKGKGKMKAKTSKPPPRQKQRDWGADADQLEKGAPNLSRADPTIRMLKYLAIYWNKAFSVVAPGLRKNGYKSNKVLKQEVASFHKDEHDPELHGERIDGIQAFQACAKRREGSRDIGAQLFTALCRALGVEARLVANLQPLGYGWNKVEDAVPKKAKVQAETKSLSSDEDGSDGDSVIIKAPKRTEGPSAKPKSKKKSKPDTVLRKSSRKGTEDAPLDLSDSSELSEAPSDSDGSVIEIAARSKRRLVKRYDRDLVFPTYWTEVISPITFKVYPVDSMLRLAAPATNDDHLALFEPRGSKADKAKQMIAYVIGHSPDGTAKDVTTRYLKRHMWPGKTKGMRLPAEKIPVYNRKGKIKKYEDYDWFRMVMSSYKRPLHMRTQVDDIEETTDLKPIKVEKKEVKEGEESLQYYRQSAEFVLERLLRREEALLVDAKPVRTFKSGKGDKVTEEPVFLRKDVVAVKTAESWHKEGRQPKPDAVPIKHAPFRAVTINRKREIEDLTRRNNGVKPMQPLFSKKQTEYIIPPPIQNGVIPKNSYGNIDCFVPSMVPEGAVHVPLRSTSRVCKKLGIDYAEAVVGFEFGKKMAIPVIQGVVVAEGNRQLLIDAWNEEELARVIKEDEKRLKLVLSTWRKFLMGLRITARIQAELGDDSRAFEREAVNPFMRTDLPPESEAEEEALAGGFMRDGEDDEEEEADSRAELEVLDHSHNLSPGDEFEEHDATGGGFMTETPDDTEDKVFDDSAADNLSSKLSSDHEEAPLSPPKKTNRTPKTNKLTQPATQAMPRRRSRRVPETTSKYFDASDEEDEQSNNDLEDDGDVRETLKPSTRAKQKPRQVKAKAAPKLKKSTRASRKTI